LSWTSPTSNKDTINALVVADTGYCFGGKFIVRDQKCAQDAERGCIDFMHRVDEQLTSTTPG